jgi:FkbM family methyltransferase
MAGALPRARSRVVRGNRWFEAMYSRLFLEHPRLHAVLIHLLLPDEDARIELFGSPLVINKRREAGYWRAYRTARSSAVLCHETGSLLSLAMLLQPGDTFVDVGANVGLYSAAFARMRHLRPGLRMYSFEANPDTARRLQAGLTGQGVTAFAIALSDRDGTLTFVEGSTSLTFGVAESGGDLQIRGRTRSVTARRLDHMGILGDSIVLKIDVENHERQVLQGAEGLFVARRVKAVYLDGYSDPVVPQFLLGHGFELFDGLTLEPGQSQTLLAVRGS